MSIDSILFLLVADFSSHILIILFDFLMMVLSISWVNFFHFIPVIVWWNLAEIFFVWLQEKLCKHFHYHYEEGFWNFSEIFCVWIGRRIWLMKYFYKFSESYIEIFHGSYMLRNSKHYTKSCRMLCAKVFDIFIPRSRTFWYQNVIK